MGMTTYLNCSSSGRVMSADALASGMTGPLHVLGLDVAQHVQQVADVEAHIQRLEAVVDIDFFLRLFLLGVGGRNLSSGCASCRRTP